MESNHGLIYQGFTEHGQFLCPFGTQIIDFSIEKYVREFTNIHYLHGEMDTFML